MKGKRKHAPNRRHFVEGITLRKGKHSDNYLIKLIPPGQHELKHVWVNVEDIAREPLSKESRLADESAREKKKKRAEFRRKLLIPLTPSDSIESLHNQGYTIEYNPPGNGNCQFSALCFLLQRIGVHRSPQSLREEIVRDLQENPDNIEGIPLELYAAVPWETYLSQMVKDGTYGDHITLQAAANIYAVKINLVSTLGVEGNHQLLNKVWLYIPFLWAILLKEMESITWCFIKMKRSCQIQILVIKKKHARKMKNLSLEKIHLIWRLWIPFLK